MKQASEGYDMNIKRYVAEDMRQALKQIREELGPDAIILSNRRVEGGVEIITSADGLMPDVTATPVAKTTSTAQRFVDSADNSRLADDSFLDDSLPEDTVELSSVYGSRGQFEQTTVNSVEDSVNGRAAQPPVAEAQTTDAPKTKRRSAVRQRRYIEDQLGGGNTASASGQAQIDDTFEHLLGQYSQPVASPVSYNENGQLMDAMRSEIESLRLLLKDQMDHSSDDRWALKNPLAAAAMKRLVAEGISHRLARKLVNGQGQPRTIDDALSSALHELATSIPVMDDSLINKNGIIALLGATGVGKTTTIAKLAVRYALKHGPDQLALVTTDSYRLAAYEQLRTLGRIIDVPVRQVDEHNSLADVLESLKHKSMVLIDTAGFHLGDKDRLQQLRVLEKVETPIKKLLVLPSTSQSKVLQSVYELMTEIKLDGCVLSKVDESSSLGEVLSLVVEKQLPVAYITNGQKIPDDIGKALPEKLVQGLTRVPLVIQPVSKAPFTNLRKPAPAFAAQHAQAGII